MGFVADNIKGALLRVDRLLDTLQVIRLVTITKEDLVRWRGGGYRRPILFDQEGHDLVRRLVAGHEPLMVSRLGAVELSCLRHYLEKRGRKVPYPRRIRQRMADNAGFFPAVDSALDDFARLYLEELQHVDVMGVWLNRYEDVVCNRFSPGADLVDLDSLEPFRFANPWSGLLAGRKVLVVHPFVDSIRRQFEEKRRLLFRDPDVLPDFELKTIRAVQSAAGSSVDFATWFDAYRFMCDRIAGEDFDVCLIGAGAYGLPLASFVKGLGKQAIHLGGVTQILFGIKGRRWEREYEDSTALLFNEHWIRPSASETPACKDKVDHGCYW